MEKTITGKYTGDDRLRIRITEEDDIPLYLPLDKIMQVYKEKSGKPNKRRG